jgi:hypothetical protein
MMVLTRRQARLLSLTDPGYRVRKAEGRWWVVDENGSIVEFQPSTVNAIIAAPAEWVHVMREHMG